MTIATALGVTVCALFLAFAGFKFMTSGGSPGAIAESKSAAFNAVIGLALILSANVIARLIQGAVVH